MATNEDIMLFCEENGLQIHPRKNLDVHVTRFNSSGHCPCDMNRTDCPCTQAYLEIDTNGVCKCTLLVNNRYLIDYGYIIDD